MKNMAGATLYLNRASHTLDFLPGARSRFLWARSNLNTLDLAIAENPFNFAGFTTNYYG